MGIFKKRYFHEQTNQSKSSSAEMGNFHHSPKCKRLQREHQMLVKLNHPNIVKCDIQFYQNEERCCIKLEQAECDFLEYTSHFFQSRNKSFFRTQIALLKNIASAIDYLHSLDIVHNDIKLENCLLFVQADLASIYQSSKKKTQNFEPTQKNCSKQQMSSSSLCKMSSNEDLSVSSNLSSSCSLANQPSQRKDSINSEGSKKPKKSGSKGKLVLKLADFEFSCSTHQTNTIEYFKTWKMRNRKYQSPELLELCNLLELQSQHSYNHERERELSNQNFLSVSSFLTSQFKRVCSLYCEEPQQSIPSTNGEEDGSDSQLTISTDHTVGSNLINNNEQFLALSQEKLYNHAKSINMKQNDIFCYGILFFSAIFGVYPFQKEATKLDPIYSLVFEERWNEFWLLFENRVQDMLEQGFPPEQVGVFKDLLEKLLSANPHARPDTQAILKHPYFASHSKSNK